MGELEGGEKEKKEEVEKEGNRSEGGGSQYYGHTHTQTLPLYCMVTLAGWGSVQARRADLLPTWVISTPTGALGGSGGETGREAQWCNMYGGQLCGVTGDGRQTN